RPVEGARVYVLDAWGEPAPVGVPGELYVGGAGVARGYLERPALTAERFLPDPFPGEGGARVYRTGDRVRWRGDGTLEYLGRLDEQVKVRGFRIELGEIEARLAEHPAVREAVVLVREDAPGDRRLVAYVVGDPAAGADVLRAHLSERLPEYMVPAAFVPLERFPLTPSGKVDRRALPAPEGDAFARRGYEEPVDATEQALAEIWAEVLRVERVGRGDSFFELGGHSLLAVQVISRVRQVLQVDVALGELFTRPVLRDFAGRLETAARAELPPIQPADRQGRVPLSFAQQRLWFLEQLGSLGGTYHIPMRLRLRGGLDRDALVRALDGIVARHEALRTTFAQVDGVPEQRIAPADVGFYLVEHDLGGEADADVELRRLVAEEEAAHFDLERGPLIRGRLIRLAPNDHVLLATMHHIVSDGWSMGVLTEELSKLYAAHAQGTEARLPVLPVQYADYAVWQRRWVESEVLQAQAEYWTRTLAGAPELLELPTDRPRPAEQDHAGARLGVELDEELTAELKALSRRHGTTLFMTLLAGWATVLSRLSGQDDVVIGTPTAGRGRREIEGLIGFFVNTLALRVDLSGAPTAAELLGRVKERALEAQHHQDIPFEQVVELVDPARSLSHAPIFQATFAWQNAPGSGLELPGLALAPLGPTGSAAQVTAKFDLSLALSERDGRIVGGVEYATSLFER
ncbi:MAG TPA: condensation domain-containing protein, partial [Longimicrobium sp.]|nr:condensation domain-containing protein [Longimicrobium sp.]